MSRLTAPKGADLNRSIEQDDDAWRAIKSYLDKTRPGMLLNIHNWMSKTEDGLFANTRRFAEKFKSLMPDQTQRGKYWKVEWTELFLEKAGAEVAKKEWSSWKNYVREEFGAVALTLEFPWFGRSPSDMRETGKKALTAFLLAGKS
jgi:hypothetical protein